MASTDSYPNGFEIRSRALSSRKRVVIDDDDEEVSETETKLITRKRAKKATVVTSPATTLNSSSNTGSKISWSKKDELHILKGIVKYEEETESSYDSDYGALCEFIEPSIEVDFTRSQLRSKIGKLKRRFDKNLAKSAPSFVDCDEHERFKLSLAIWAKPISQIAKDVADEQIIEHADPGKDLMGVEVTESLEQCDYMEQAEQVEYEQTLDHQEVTQLVEHDETVDHEQNQQTVQQVTQLVEHNETVDHEQTEEQNQQTVDQVTQLVEHDETVDNEQVTRLVEHDQTVDHEQNQPSVEQVTHTMEQEQATLTVAQADDLPPVENEHITETLERIQVDIGEEEREKVGAEELRLLQEALKELVFPTLGEVHQRFLLQNLNNLEAEEGKQLTEEWKALVVEEITLKIKIMRYSAKLADAIASG